MCTSFSSIANLQVKVKLQVKIHTVVNGEVVPELLP